MPLPIVSQAVAYAGKPYNVMDYLGGKGSNAYRVGSLCPERPKNSDAGLHRQSHEGRSIARKKSRCMTYEEALAYDGCRVNATIRVGTMTTREKGRIEILNEHMLQIVNQFTVGDTPIADIPPVAHKQFPIEDIIEVELLS